VAQYDVAKLLVTLVMLTGPLRIVLCGLAKEKSAASTKTEKKEKVLEEKKFILEIRKCIINFTN
jgi:hypothetical protein